jgi:hypothetical protein
LSQLTAVWWQWVFSVPVSASPLFDETGAHANNGQPYSGLLFLAGTFIVNQTVTGDQIAEVTRSITVKRGTALFFPLINNEFDNVCGTTHLGGNCFGLERFPHVLGVPELQANASAAAGAVLTPTLHSTLTPADAAFHDTGEPQNLGYARLASPPFAFTLPATDNLYQFFGIQVSGTVAPAAADGFFTFIPGILSPGNYVLRFGGSTPINDVGNTFTDAITYKITVMP